MKAGSGWLEHFNSAAGSASELFLVTISLGVHRRAAVRANAALLLHVPAACWMPRWLGPDGSHGGEAGGITVG
jgi:hypothetical protein